MRKLLVHAVALTCWAAAGVAMAADTDLMIRGKALFTAEAVPACAICHTLADAGAEGAIGPDLDELKPTKDVVLKVLKEGMGAMPSFAESLSQEEMEALAGYVVEVTGR